MRYRIIEDILFFLAGVAATITVQFCVVPCLENTHEPDELTVAETNRASKVNSQVDWFKDGSKFIWDDWKLK